MASAAGGAADAGDASLVEVEHVIGYTGKAGPLALPNQELGYAVGIGAQVALCDVSDPHNQAFLKGHDADVIALDVSSGGRFVASGQTKSPAAAAGDSPVICWDVKSGKGLYNFFGIFQGVASVKFSPDERLLAAAGRDMSLFVWDLATGEQILGKHLNADAPDGITFLAWGPIFASAISKRPAYTLAYSVHDRIQVATIEYDFRVMRYAASIAQATTPSSGYSRKYTCAVVDPTGSMLAAGTTAGEVALYQLKPALIYRTALLASSNGVQSLVVSPTPQGPDGRAVLYVGGGDGSVRSFTGRDLAWVCTAETKLAGAVVALSLAASGSWMLAGTAAGRIQRVSFGCDLRAGVPMPAHGQAGARGVVDTVEVSHTGGVNAVAFHPQTSDAIVTVSTDTSIRLWDLNSYGSPWSTAGQPAGTYGTCVWVAGPTGGAAAAAGAAGPAPGMPCDAYAGFSDGTLRAYTVGYGPGVGAAAAGLPPAQAGGEAWRANAHRGGVTCITGNRAVVITGGNDGRVNVWSRAQHDLLLTFHEHSKPVTAVAVDVSNPEVVYSCSLDRCMQTMNLRAERKVKSHALPPADTLATTLTCLAQCTHASTEREVLAGTSDGRLFVFDPAMPDTHVGVTDVLALLVERERSGAGMPGEVPKAKPGQVRPDLKLVAIRMSPSGLYLAAATSCGRLIVLAPGSSVPTAPPRPTATGYFTDLSGTVRTAIKSGVAAMKVQAVHLARAVYTDLQWAPDERQLVASAADGSITIVNWYGSQ